MDYDIITGFLPSIVGLYTDDGNGFMDPCSRDPTLVPVRSMPSANSVEILEDQQSKLLDDDFPKMDRWTYPTIKLMEPLVEGLYTEDEDGFMVPCSRASTSITVASPKLDGTEQLHSTSHDPPANHHCLNNVGEATVQSHSSPE